MIAKIYLFVFFPLAVLLVTSLCADTPAIYCEQKTIVSSLCPNVSDSMLQSGIKFGTSAYRYRLTTAVAIELTSPQALLLALINSLVTGDVVTCSALAECSHHIKQLRSNHLRLWLREDFRFTEKDIRVALAQLDAGVTTGTLKLPAHVITIIHSLAEVHKIALQSKKELLDHGADVSAKTIAGWNPLMEASYVGHLEIVKLLIGRGAPLNDTNNDGYTALHYASKGGYVGVAKELLDHGADVSAKTIAGWNPLMEACYVGHLEIVKLLIGRGAPLNDRNFSGKTALGLTRNLDVKTYIISKGGVV
nr:uncharacterized protein LOC106686759 [Halyomorpha halys]